MTPLLRAAAAASMLLFPAARPLFAAAPADTSALRFHGFRAGAKLAELDRLLRSREGSRMRCDRSKRDARVQECRGVVKDSALGGTVELWVSAIDSTAGVITLSAEMDSVRFARWLGGIEARYGRVRPSRQGSQSMMQWVRRGRMLRLTWRIERGKRTASVSLVDGRVLDEWGKARSSK
jgi:hypothetical protein